MIKKVKIGCWILIIILLGFLRGYLFGNINWIYKTLTENRPNQARKEFHALLEWSTSEILILKWSLTFIFFGLFAFLTWYIIRLIFNHQQYSRITLLVFAGILLIAAILYPVYYLLGSPLKIYLIIRTIMGLGQSFMPLMLLIITFKFIPQLPSND